MLSVSTAICNIEAGGFVAEHLRKISSFTCQIHPVFDPLFVLDGDFEGVFWLTLCRSNICLIFRQEVGATMGAATFRFRLLKAAPCHVGVPDGDDIGVDVEFGCDMGS